MFRLAPALAAALALTGPAAGQGLLEQVREAAGRERPADDDRAKSANQCQNEWGPADGSPGCGPSADWGSILVPILTAPWALPYELCEGSSGHRGRFLVTPGGPYGGNFLVDRGPDDPTARAVGDLKAWSARAAVEAGSDFSGLTRIGLRAAVETAEWRLGLKSDWDGYRERLAAGRRDEFWLGDLTGTFRFVQTDRFQMHTGLGVRFLVDRGRDHAGVNFLYGFDLFPARPWHVGADAEAGTLGHANFVRLRGGTGVVWRNLEFGGGYDWFHIGGVNLHGPYTSLRLWF